MFTRPSQLHGCLKPEVTRVLTRPRSNRDDLRNRAHPRHAPPRTPPRGNESGDAWAVFDSGAHAERGVGAKARAEPGGRRQALAIHEFTCGETSGDVTTVQGWVPATDLPVLKRLLKVKVRGPVGQPDPACRVLCVRLHVTGKGAITGVVPRGRPRRGNRRQSSWDFPGNRIPQLSELGLVQPGLSRSSTSTKRCRNCLVEAYRRRL